jgi:leucyl aminopeptidase (aminopeptidase T)
MDIYRESNEMAEERLVLARERSAEISQDPDVSVTYQDYFRKTAAFAVQLAKLCEEVLAAQKENHSRTAELSLEECEAENLGLYQDILGAQYDSSYANPAYAVAQLGEEFGQLLAQLTAHLRGTILDAYKGDALKVTIALELFIGIYNHFETQVDVDGNRSEAAVDEKELRQEIYWYFHDNSEIFLEERIRRLIDPQEDFEWDIVMNADLSDLRYLYRYGAYIGENERKIAVFLNGLSEEEIQSMADTYTEGYRIGFEMTGKDLSKKQVAQIRYPIGFERMVRAAVCNFRKMNLKVTMQANGIAANKQYDFDHREDRALYLDKAYIERTLEVYKNCFEEKKELAAGMAGPAVIEVFGEQPFSPETKKEALHYSEKQQQLCVYDMSMRGQITNQYIRGEERSFTIIAYPIPAIGAQFEEIFAETVKINTLDYVRYRDMQQKMIDVLDTADRVHITGKGANKTDLYVNIWKLADAAKETAFENCVADVNIPVGEVFTSPVLENTTGKLFVSQVYLNELNYENLEIDFVDGMIADYTCTNFAEEAENKKYIRDNVLMHHDTLPMGEFAIGTNTTAYRMARDYKIADKLPILIAEKTGPHFAVGDTCYSHEEDNLSYNPDGKAIVARENAVSALRKVPEAEGGGMEKAYFNCHTDITIPYDELDKITVIRKDGSTQDIIADGRFVLEGTEELNLPLDAPKSSLA